MTDSVEIAVLAAEFRGHSAEDRASFSRINQDTTEIKATLATMASKLDAAVERIHSRIDAEAAVSRAGVKSAMDFTQEAHDRIGENKAWVLGSAAATLLAIVGWFADHFFVGGRHGS